MTLAKPDTVSKLGPRIRKQRHRLSMTLQQLGEAAGVSVGYLSQVERGNATPTLGTLAQVSAALGVTVDFFVSTPKTQDSLTRAGQRPRFSMSGSSLEYEQINASFPGHELTSYIITVPPGYVSEEVSHEGEEVIYILEGEIMQVIDGQEHIMREGDSLHYLGTDPHAWSNRSDDIAKILWVGRMQFAQSGAVHGIRPDAASEQGGGGPVHP